MTLPSAHSTFTTHRSVSVSSEPSSTTFLPSSHLGIAGGATLRAVNVAPVNMGSVNVAPVNMGSVNVAPVNMGSVSMGPVSTVQYVNGAVDGSALYGNVRYLMPVQRQSEYVVVNRQSPQMLTPVYLQNVRHVNVNTVEEMDGFRHLSVNGKAPSEISLPPSPIKSPDPPEVSTYSVSNVHENVEIDLHHKLKNEVKLDVVDVEPKDKLDTRFFGELLADVYRKNCDIHTCMSEHVSKISGRKQLVDSDYKAENEEIEQLIPKGVSELTKQQIRYLLQTRTTADKTMRLLLSTFSTLREELVHLQEDLRRLESDKEQLERDLSFKADQSQQYEKILETLRENNRQLQNSLKDSSSAHRNLETQLMSSRSTDTSRDFRIKDLESSKRALEQENELLRKKLENQSSSSSLNAKNQELSRHYEKMLNELREDKERELKNMRSQLVKIQTEYTTDRSSDKSLQLRITELLSSLEQRDTTIRRLEEDIRRLQQEKNDSKSSSRTVITKTYTNQYPILGLLSDDYHYTSPVKESKTVVVESTG